MKPVGLAVLALGAVALACSGSRLAAGNPTERILAWRNPPVRPGRAIALRGIGAGLVVLGGVVTTQTYLGVIVLILAAWTPAAIVHVAHNRRVRRESTT